MAQDEYSYRYECKINHKVKAMSDLVSDYLASQPIFTYWKK